MQPIQSQQISVAQTLCADIERRAKECSSGRGSLTNLQSRCNELSLVSLQFRAEQLRTSSPVSSGGVVPVLHGIDPALIDQIKRILDLVDDVLGANKRGLNLERKWIDLGLPVEVLQGPKNFLEAFFSSCLSYQLAAYSKLTPGQQSIRYNAQTKDVELLFEGKFLSWTDFDKAYEWSDARDAFIGRADASIELTLTAFPEGFIKKSRFSYQDPFPIAQLSSDQLTQVRQQAAMYQQVDGESLRLPHAVLQLYTSPGGFSGPAWLRDAFAATGEVPSHYGVRLIDDKGYVYSFGYMMDPNEETTWASPLRLASTVKSCIAIADYDEFRKFGERYVTSLPLSFAAYANTMKHIVGLQKGGQNVFNFGRDNCASFTADVLNAAGYQTPDLKVDMGHFFYGLVVAPLKAIPVLSSVVTMAEKVVKTVVDWFKSLSACSAANSPVVRPLRKVYSFCTAPISFMTSTVVSVIKWCCTLVLGGKKVSPYVQEKLGDKAASKAFLGQWQDMFRYDATDMTSSEALLEWQKQQKSTQIFQYQGPQITIVK